MMNQVPDGLVRNMRVEEMRVENGRTFVTYSFASLRPLDTKQIILKKSQEVTWDEFKQSTLALFEDLEKRESEFEGVSIIEISAEQGIEFLDEEVTEEEVEIEYAEDGEETECPFCGAELDEEGFCPHGCEDQADESDLEDQE